MAIAAAAARVTLLFGLAYPAIVLGGLYIAAQQNHVPVGTMAYHILLYTAWGNVGNDVAAGRHNAHLHGQVGNRPCRHMFAALTEATDVFWAAWGHANPLREFTAIVEESLACDLLVRPQTLGGQAAEMFSHLASEVYPGEWTASRCTDSLSSTRALTLPPPLPSFPPCRLVAVCRTSCLGLARDSTRRTIWLEHHSFK